MTIRLLLPTCEQFGVNATGHLSQIVEYDTVSRGHCLIQVSPTGCARCPQTVVSIDVDVIN